MLAAKDTLLHDGKAFNARYASPGSRPCPCSRCRHSLAVPCRPAQDSVKTHALTLGDEPKYGPDFKHLDYVNPDAPKGGTVRYAGVGSFDSFNPFIVGGDPAGLGGLYETLTTPNR